ncbi:MAG: hypothetical protein JNJ43_19060, partial [Anaerolineales bacterium]|nr:hypothetical protein [Anaerolineales bacterium]
MTSNKNTLVASEPLNWKDGAMILLAVLTFGMGWVADNTEAVISWLAVLI